MTIQEMSKILNNRVKEIVLTETELMEKIKGKSQEEQKNIIHDLALYTLLFGNPAN